MRTYRLTAADGSTYASATKGEYGGNRRHRVYGTMGCGVARDQLRRFPETMVAHRVFFADEATALAAGYRPCGSCLRPRFLVRKARLLAALPDGAAEPALVREAAAYGPEAEAAAWLRVAVGAGGLDRDDLGGCGFPRRIVAAVAEF